MAARMTLTVERAKRDASGHRIKNLSGSAVGAGTESDFIRQDVCGACGQRPEGHFGTGHAVHGFVDSAVASGGEDKIAALGCRETREFARFVGAGSSEKLYLVAGAQEYLYRVVQAGVLPASQAARKRVINDSDSMAQLSDNFESRRTRL
jgi:hypothetical protein